MNSGIFRIIFLILITGASAPLIASVSIRPVIPMDNPYAYPVHKKPVVMFTHEKHASDYGIACGTCHHGADGNPLSLKRGDAVQSCLSCHKPGKAPRAASGTSAEDRKKQRISYHYGAIHEQCVSCHREVNEKQTGNKSKGPAPATCRTCHK